MTIFFRNKYTKKLFYPKLNFLILYTYIFCSYFLLIKKIFKHFFVLLLILIFMKKYTLVITE